MTNAEIDQIQAELEKSGEIDPSDATALLNYAHERRWISVKERLPEPDTFCLTWDTHSGSRVG